MLVKVQACKIVSPNEKTSFFYEIVLSFNG